MLLMDVHKEEFLTYLPSFMAFSWDSESHLVGTNWPSIGYGCVPQLGGEKAVEKKYMDTWLQEDSQNGDLLPHRKGI